MKTARALHLFRWLMIVVTLSSLVGVYFHLQGNLESVLERTPDLSRTAQLWEAMQGRNPLLAPGVMAQVGLLSLAATFRHPRLKTTPTLQRGL